MARFDSPTAFAQTANTTKPTSTIQLHHVSLRLPDGRMLFDDLNESFAHERIGLVGRNGAGKSMLARMLAGLIAPEHGRIECSSVPAYVPQDLHSHPDATIAELAGLAPLFAALQRIEAGTANDDDFDLLDGHWDIRLKLAQVLTEAGLGSLHADSPAAALSGGEVTRVALAGAFLSGADILILDEPSNHLDRHARAWLMENIRQWQGGLIVVSHDRTLLSHMDRIVELEAGMLRSYGGNYRVYREQKEREQSAAQDSLDHARAARARTLRTLKQQHDDRSRRTARNAKHAKTANLPGIYQNRLREGAEAYAGRERQRVDDTKRELDQSVRDAAARLTTPPPVALILPGTAVPASKRILELEEAIPPYPAHAPAMNMILTGPVRIGLVGPNGCGKTTLLKMLAGQLAPASGYCHTHVATAWLDQHATQLLPPDKSVLQQLDALNSPLSESERRERLALLGLAAAHVGIASGLLSGGERLKAALACALWGEAPAQLLLLDEPTNHLDLASVIAFEQALSDYPGALIMASHDQALLDALNLSHHLRHSNDGWQLIAT
ncbi:MAG: ABC-F family ATP-binding cassette domain-containing protein [Pseudomonadota bacterium]